MILERLADGSVNLTTVGLLAAHLTLENHQQVLDTARHKRRRQVEELVAQLQPRPAIPDVVRKLPTAMSVDGGSDATSLRLEKTPDASESLPASAPPPAAQRRGVVVPLAPQRYKVQFTASAETCRKLRLAQDLLRHQIPNGDLEQVVDRALTVLLHHLARQKLAATDRPRGSVSGDSGSRHVSAEVRRAVWLRDGGRCAFVGHGGRRCTERGFLEFHHVVPYSAGGHATTSNVQLRCRAHNQYERST